jgi:phage I-like protein
MDQTLTAICDRELAGVAPDWVHLFPAGEMTGRDGRRFNLADPQTVIHAFARSAVDLPVDYEHQSDRPGVAQAGPVPAAGWIKELKADALGLWGRVEWTAQARELISAKAYRYLSPSFMYAKAGGVITRLKGAGLVHNPNLQLRALASQEDDMNDYRGFLQRLVTFLKLPEGATEQEVFDKLEKMGPLLEKTATAAIEMVIPDPAKYVPIEAVADLMKDRNEGRAIQNEERAKTKVTDALARGYISPAMKDWATALCTQDETSFDAFIAKSVAPFAHILKPSHMTDLPPGSAPGSFISAQSSVASSVCSQLGLKPGTLEE